VKMASHLTWLIVVVVAVLIIIILTLNAQRPMKSFGDILNDVTVADQLQDHANRIRKREVIEVYYIVYLDS